MIRARTRAGCLPGRAASHSLFRFSLTSPVIRTSLEAALSCSVLSFRLILRAQLYRGTRLTCGRGGTLRSPYGCGTICLCRLAEPEEGDSRYTAILYWSWCWWAYGMALTGHLLPGELITVFY